MVVFEDHAPNVAATIIILSVTALVVFPLRVYTRIRHQAWGLDDWSMTVAAIPFTALSVFCLGSSFLGVGTHKEKLDAHQTEQGMMWFFFFEVFFCITIIPVKLSISFMLIRIAGPKQNYKYAVYAMSTLFVVLNLISFFYIIFRCDPVSFAWDTTTPSGSCLPARDLANVYYADTAVNIMTDWFCALTPIPLLWNLQLNTNSKISVGFLLSLGVLASLSACIRLKYTVNLNNSDDYLYSVGDVVIWGYAENGVGFVVGCIATLRPLFRKMFHLGSSDHSNIKLSGEASGELYRAGSAGLPHAGPKRANAKTTITSQLRKGSDGSGSTSEEYILQDLNGTDVRQDLKGIHVSRTVMQTRD
ncbi:hypothetical protein DOTSEDRAFT_66792 [Dothistroma septosporum NZE10]|uniref:Rhodopsin domain-containing protein n=1 Tax=Dothistroma septosporum (strain NZE10 / CBS 128990) TaxID=675120 RepID=M2XH53_DOTSN|nr:hypothetical protein DOTSEDRAFT_66792 [Dothistroma septosporum NZE10]